MHNTHTTMNCLTMLRVGDEPLQFGAGKNRRRCHSLPVSLLSTSMLTWLQMLEVTRGQKIEGRESKSTYLAGREQQLTCYCTNNNSKGCWRSGCCGCQLQIWWQLCHLSTDPLMSNLCKKEKLRTRGVEHHGIVLKKIETGLEFQEITSHSVPSYRDKESCWCDGCMRWYCAGLQSVSGRRDLLKCRTRFGSFVKKLHISPQFGQHKCYKAWQNLARLLDKKSLLQGEARSLSLSLCSLALAEEQGCRNNTPRCKTRDPWKMCVFQKSEKKISLPLPVWVRIAYRNRTTKQSKAAIMILLSR